MRPLPLMGDRDRIQAEKRQIARIEIDAKGRAADFVVQLQEAFGGVGEPTGPHAIDCQLHVAGLCVGKRVLEIGGHSPPSLGSLGSIVFGTAHVEDDERCADGHGQIDRSLEVERFVGKERVGEIGVGDDGFDGQTQPLGNAPRLRAQLGRH